MSGLDNQYYMDFSTQKVEEIKALLKDQDPPKNFEALKRLCSFSVKGFDVSTCFPDVAKAIITPSLDCKRLIYQFIVINGKKAPDLCLLCVDRLHKDSTENDNPLIRGLALRTLSSLSAPEIVQVLQHDVTRSTRDSSPYVRKAAAFAITKLVNLEPTLTDSMIELISQMLSKEDNTQVLGPVLFAFNTVCPERWDLIHPNFRRIVLLLVDLDEWAQILVLNILLRYARSQFPSPFAPPDEKPAKDEKDKGDHSEESESESEGDAFENFLTKKDFITSTKGGTQLISSSGEVDDDLRYILTNIQPLLQSSNPGVVLGVATFMFYCSPEAEFLPAAKAVTRLIFQGTPTSDIILRSIAAMAVQRPSLFSAVYRDFFIFDSFTRYGKLVRLTILSHIVTGVNARPILREFAEYVQSQDKVFVCATIHAIYRISLTVPSVLPQCMKAAMGLLRSTNNDVVGAAIVCIKNLIQYQMANLEHRKEKSTEKKKGKKSKKGDDDEKKDGSDSDEKESERKKKKKSKKKDNFDLLFDTLKDNAGEDEEEEGDTAENAEKEITKVLVELISMLHTITNTTARACIVWLLGHYPHLIPHHAPDALRELVASFCDENRDVKFQILTFATKLQLHAQAILAGEDMLTGQAEAASPDAEPSSSASASAASKKQIFPAATCELIGKLFVQVQNLARFDADTDIRERSRFYRSLLNDHTALRRAVARALVADRPKPSASTESELNLTKFTVGSISHIINAPILGYKPLPDFPLAADPEAQALRAPTTTTSPIAVSGAHSISPQSIHSFYSSGSGSSRSRSRSSSRSSSGSSSSRSRSRSRSSSSSGSRSLSSSSRSRSRSASSSASRSRSASSSASRSRKSSPSETRSESSTSSGTSSSTSSSSSSSRGRKRTRSDKKKSSKKVSRSSSRSSSSDSGAKKDGDADAMFISF